MADLVKQTQQGSVAYLAFENGRDNAMSRALCQQLGEALRRLLSSDNCNVIVLMAQGSVFSRGLDLNWLNQDLSRPELLQLCDQIEDASKPVIAALQGDALGAGFELALAAHHRLAAPGVRVGLPDITIGLPPAAGASQRLPRLIGSEATLQLLLSGKTIGANALGPVFDAEITGDFEQGCHRFAQALADKTMPPIPSADRREGFADQFAYQAAVDRFRAKNDGKGQAALDILRCVEAAPLLPFGAGLALEQECFLTCADRDRPKALRHLLMAERRLSSQAAQMMQDSAPIKRVAILGETTLGAGLAVDSLLAGMKVTFVTLRKDGAENAHETVASFLTSVCQSRGIDQAAQQSALARLTIEQELEACAGAELVVEATNVTLETKQRIFEDLGYILPGQTVLACARALEDLSICAEASGRPHQVIGFYRPMQTPSGAAMEMVNSSDASGFALAMGAQFAAQLSTSVIPVKGPAGIAAGTMMVGLWNMADQLLRDGVGIYQIDKAWRDFGCAMGPFEMLDVFGIPAALDLAKKVDPEEGAHMRVLRAMSQAGYVGKDAGVGFYNYDDETALQPNGGAQKVLTALGIKPQPDMPVSAIQTRCLAALANAGASLLREEQVEHASDLDLLMVKGFGFSKFRGGPMQAADRAGLLGLKNVLTDQAQMLTPDPYLSDLIKNGQSFSSPNR